MYNLRNVARIARMCLWAAICTAPVRGANWTAIGPTTQALAYDFLSQHENVSGRVSALAYAPDVDGAGTPALFVGAAGGGVWRSTDFTSASPTWTPLTDILALDPYTECGAIDVGCIAVDTARHPNIIYVGTGEANFSGDSRYGAGILKSSNGGNTWALVGAGVFGKRSVSRIIIDPTDTTGKTLYASMVYSSRSLSANYGVYKSIDGGTVWTQQNGTMGSGAVVTDLEYTVATSGGLTLYAAVGQPGGTAANGLYRSTDKAVSWTKLSGGAPSGSAVSRIALAASHTASANPDVYAVAAAPDGSAYGFYHSSDGGTTWAPSYTGNFPSSQGWYDLAIGLANDGTLYLGGVSHPFNYAAGVLESTDRGATWSAVDVGTNGDSPHTDFHAMAAVGDTMYVGNDGGVWRFTPAPAHPQPYTAPRLSKIGGYPSSMAAGLLDADSYPDTAVASYYDNAVYVSLGNGDGTFGAPVKYTVGTNPNQVVLGDFNSDQILDIATANVGTTSVSILLGTGGGSFSAAVSYSVGGNPGGLYAADINGDHNLDIVTTNQNGTISVLPGDGLGHFGAAINTAVPGGSTYGIVAADFNGDGFMDVATSDYANSRINVLTGDGTGHFAPIATYTTASGPVFLAVDKLTGSGKPDLVTANYNSSSVSVFINNSVTGGAIAFAPAISIPVDGPANCVAIGNLDGGAFKDIVTANDDNTVSVLMGSSPGVFSPAVSYPAGPGPTSVVIADFNADTKADIGMSAFQGCVAVDLSSAAVVKGRGVWDDLNTSGLGTIQMQGMAIHPTDPNIYVEGSQDNGTARRDSSTGTIWNTVYGGDGGMARFDPQNGNFCYKVGPKGSLGSGFFSLSTDSGLNWLGKTSTINNDLTFPGDEGDRQLAYQPDTLDAGTFPFYPVFAVDPLNGQRVIIGSSYVYETRNRGTSWSFISSQLAGGYGVTAITYAPSNDNVIYAGYGNGQVFTTTTDGAAWSDASGGSPWGGRQISSIAVDPADPTIAYVSIPSLSTGRVWKTVNAGLSWADISATLPAIPVNSLAIDPRTKILYAGADLGVWATPDSGLHWYRYGASLPSAQVLDLTLNTSTNILGAATHGRSAFTIGIMPGDVNGDGAVNTADAVLALQIAAGLRIASPDEWMRGNIASGTAGITLEDAAAIARKANGL